MMMIIMIIKLQKDLKHRKLRYIVDLNKNI